MQALYGNVVEINCYALKFEFDGLLLIVNITVVT